MHCQSSAACPTVCDMHVCALLQLFWFVPSRLLWNVTFTRQEPEAPSIIAEDGPQQQRPPAGAFQQSKEEEVPGAVEMIANPQYWSQMYQTLLRPHVTPAVLPARE